MSEKTNIAWTDSTHNFWRGCTKVSDGCKHCYAESLVTTRLQGEWGKGAPRIRSKNFDEPLKWNKKPWVCDGCGQPAPDALCASDCCVVGYHRRRVFSLSLGDWLDDEVPIEWLADMLDVIRRCPNLDFLLLTKRPENWRERLALAINRLTTLPATDEGWAQVDFLQRWWKAEQIPLNIWLGVSVENQATADERIPKLLEIPAVCRFVSYEPALGPVDFWLGKRDGEGSETPLDGLHWIIVGGESGPHARPFNVEWARSTIGQCKVAGVACFVKQLGANCVSPLGGYRWPMKDKKGGDWSEWPADLRVREWPKAAEILRQAQDDKAGTVAT